MEDIKHGRSHPGPMRYPTCLCGAQGVRSEKWETYYCPTSGVWLENKCGDKKCYYCTNRPEKEQV